MRVLAFDTATKTGVCVGDAGSTPRAWSVDLGKAEWEVRFARTLRMVERYVTDYKPDLVAIEAPVGGRDANADLIGLIACVKGQANRMGIRTVAYFPASVRKHFLGKALTGRDFPGKSHAAAKGAIKAAVLSRCHMLGWDVNGHDAADAAALWDYTCAMESRSHQITSLPGLFAGRK